MGFWRAWKRRTARTQSFWVGLVGFRVWKKSRRGAWRSSARRRQWWKWRQRLEAVSVWSKNVEMRRMRRVGIGVRVRARASWTRSRVGLRWWSWASMLERMSV